MTDFIAKRIHIRVILVILTETVVPVFLQQVPSIALTVEGGNLIDTHLITTAIGCATLINIWITNMGVTNDLHNNFYLMNNRLSVLCNYRHTIVHHQPKSSQHCSHRCSSQQYWSSLVDNHRCQLSTHWCLKKERQEDTLMISWKVHYSRVCINVSII